MSEHLIRIEQRHIDAGLPGEPQACPIALAVREALGVDWASVGTLELILPAVGGYCNSAWGPGITDWIERFDNLGGVAPFEFRLVIPDSVSLIPKEDRGQQ